MYSHQLRPIQKAHGCRQIRDCIEVCLKSSILSFARSTDDKPERPYEFHTVVRQALASTRVEAERRNQEIVIDLDQVRSLDNHGQFLTKISRVSTVWLEWACIKLSTSQKKK
jgi:hypothetical protein